MLALIIKRSRISFERVFNMIYASLANWTNKFVFQVKSEEFLAVARDSQCRVNNGLDATVDPLPPNVVVDRAITQLGRRKYNILFSNCEHFVKWCRYGSKRSDQVSEFSQAFLFNMIERDEAIGKWLPDATTLSLCDEIATIFYITVIVI